MKLNDEKSTSSAVYPSALFGVSFRALEVRDARDVCLLSNIMEADVTWLVLLPAKKKIGKSQQQCLFPEILDLLTQDNPQILL